MAWDSTRQVPWKKLGIYLVLYAAIVFVIFAVTNKKSSLVSTLPGLVLGVVIAGTLMVVLTKFGWKLPFLRSREELAEARALRLASRRQRGTRGRSAGSSRSSASGSSDSSIDGPRPRPAPTSRTTTGPSQHRSNTVKKRKR